MMDVGGIRHRIHHSREFTTKDIPKSKEYQVDKNIWKKWWNVNKAFANTCDDRTFAQVLKQSQGQKQSVVTNKVKSDLSYKNSKQRYGYKAWHEKEYIPKTTGKYDCVGRQPILDNGLTSNHRQKFQWQIPLENRYLVLEQETLSDDSQDQEVKSNNQGHTKVKQYPKKVKNTQQHSNHQSIQQQVCHSTTNMDHGYIAPVDQTYQPMATPQGTEHTDSDLSVQSIHLDKIPDYVLQHKHLCQDYNNFIQQTGSEVGFVPLTPLLLYQGPPKIWQACPDIIQAHKLIQKSGLPNFLSCRIPIQGQLKSDRWRYHLQGYWDRQLVDLITYGFPLDFDRNVLLKSVAENHKSALDFPQEIDKYIQTEIRHGALLGPYQSLPIDSHISPLMTRAKQNSEKRRTIIDLSWPKGHAVNTGVHKSKYLGTYFKLQYPSVDNITEALNNLGPGAMLYKVDISRAFRHIRIDPKDIDLLGISHNNLYLDQSLPFGFRHGSVFFQRCSDAIRHIMRQHGFPGLWNYIDDLIYTGLPSTIHQSYQFLISLLHDLGLDISKEKLVAPATSVVCLGINIDTRSRTISIPDQKLQEIKILCQNWSHKVYCTKNQLQSLLGSLLYITKCVKPARSFLNRMLAVLRENYENSKIKLSHAFFKDLNWFNVFLHQYNGITFYDNQKIDEVIYLDACLTGLGGTFNNMVYTLPIPLNYGNFNINHLEMINIMVALKIWGHIWANKKVRIHCDNLPVVEVLNSGRARDDTLATCARNIWLLSALYNITLKVTHIAGSQNNMADLLSRWKNTTQDYEKLYKKNSQPTMDYTTRRLIVI